MDRDLNLPDETELDLRCEPYQAPDGRPWRFQSPPGWPATEADWVPPVGWDPEPSWADPPASWQFWLRSEYDPRQPPHSEGWHFHPPPGWPLPPDPPHPDWLPEPDWPPAPEGWRFWSERRNYGKAFCSALVAGWGVYLIADQVNGNIALGIAVLAIVAIAGWFSRFWTRYRSLPQPQRAFVWTVSAVGFASGVCLLWLFKVMAEQLSRAND